ncbi:MAG: ribosomal RNA small subunit methyltransferase A [Chloroflexi bacterium]|nr:ribosomal RNA small subunit methyltransferase A [Chloroflexota bacterium]
MRPRNQAITSIDRQTPPKAPGPRAKKSLGQNFLADGRVVSRILHAAEISADDLVLEIGPGRGVLTRRLAERAGRVVAVELDDALADSLKSEFEDSPNVSIMHADAREASIDELVPAGMPYKLVANLPYYAASPIIRRFLEADHKPKLMVVMVQREVARSMCAEPGKMSILSVATQLYGSPRVVMSVPPRAFRPSPKVTSAVVRIDVYDSPCLELDSEERFFDLVRAGFSAPRKQVHNCLQKGLDISKEQAEGLLEAAGVDPRRRPQTLSLNEWGGLYGAYCLKYGHDERTAIADSEGIRQNKPHA